MNYVIFHHSKILKLWFIKNIVIMKYVPTYNPQLNPTEEVFGVVKSIYRVIRPLSREGIPNFYNSMRRYLDLSFQRRFF